MSPQDISLISRHAAWVLDADPEAGLEAFVQMRPMLPPADVLPILKVSRTEKEDGRDLCQRENVSSLAAV